MIAELEKGISIERIQSLKTELNGGQCSIREVTDGAIQKLVLIGKSGKSENEMLKMAGVTAVHHVKSAYKLASRETKKSDSSVRIGNVVVGEDRIVIIAGPCAIESRDQAMTIATEVKRYGAVLFRGGAYKPRSSPYSFQGLEEEGLKILAEVREKTGLGVVTEMTSVSQKDLMETYVDAVQIGARNMQNFELLKCVGKMKKPVVLKRGLSATIEEWLMSAEYIMSGGNSNVILCERGIRTFEPYTRNTLDLSAIPVLRNLTHLPIIIDPSHATGIREKVSPMARAAVAAGADALMIEVHHDPDNALSDGPQSLYPEQFGQLARDIYVIAPVIGKQMDFDYLKKQSVSASDHTAKEKNAAFIGELGAYSHKALTGYFGSEVTPVPKNSFKQIFESVDRGECAYGVVPLENSLSGTIYENYDLLQDYQLSIVGEITIRIQHALIANPGVKKNEIRQIYGPIPALSQCKNYLGQYPEIAAVRTNSTSSAILDIKEKGLTDAAAIGSTMAARIYEMQVIEESIEDNPQNYTRFAIIAGSENKGKDIKKTSLIFSVGNKPGALFEVMKIFAEHRINLVKLESRPMSGKPWEYMFYTDVEVDLAEEKYTQTMTALKNATENLRVLGRY